MPVNLGGAFQPITRIDTTSCNHNIFDKENFMVDPERVKQMWEKEFTRRNAVRAAKGLPPKVHLIPPPLKLDISERPVSGIILTSPAGVGTGSCVKYVLSWLGYREKSSCDCEYLSKLMDRWGPDGCLSRMEHILDKMAENAKSQNIYFCRSVAERLVRICIWRSRRNLQNFLSKKPPGIDSNQGSS